MRVACKRKYLRMTSLELNSKRKLRVIWRKSAIRDTALPLEIMIANKEDNVE